MHPADAKSPARTGLARGRIASGVTITWMALERPRWHKQPQGGRDMPAGLLRKFQSRHDTARHRVHPPADAACLPHGLQAHPRPSLCGLLAPSAKAQRMAMPPANPAAAEAVDEFMQRVAGLDITRCTLRQRPIVDGGLSSASAFPPRRQQQRERRQRQRLVPRPPQPAEDHRERRGLLRSIPCHRGKTGKGRSRKGQ